MNDLDPRLLLDMVQWLVTLALVFSVWVRQPGTDAIVAVQRFKDEMNDALAEHGGRLTSVETHKQHIPTHEDLTQLEATVKQLSERSVGVAETLRDLRGQLNRIEDFLRATR